MLGHKINLNKLHQNKPPIMLINQSEKKTQSSILLEDA